MTHYASVEGCYLSSIYDASGLVVFWPDVSVAVFAGLHYESNNGNNEPEVLDCFTDPDW